MDDAALVALARDGHREAIETLLERHENGAYTAALRLLGAPGDAEDVAQEALVRAFTRIADLGEHASFGAWLRRIAINLSLNVLRRRGQLRFEPLDGGGRERDDGSLREAQYADERAVSPEESAVNAHLRDEVDRLVRELPAEQRVAVVLRDMYGYEVSEVAAFQKCGISAAKMRITRGRARLRERMVAERIDVMGARA